MPVFRYRARTSSGELTTGTVEATNAEQAATQIVGRGWIPVAVEEVPADRRGTVKGGSRKEGELPEWLSWLDPARRAPKLDDVLFFTRQFYSLVKAGVPTIVALNRLADTLPNVRLGEAVREIARDIEAGRDLASAFARHRSLFGTLYLGMLRAGEESGKLEEFLQSLGVYLERDKVTTQRIKAALRYPAIVLTVITIAVAILTIFVIPQFASVFAGAGMELPLPTRIILGVSKFMQEFWWVVLGGMAAAYWGFYRYTETPRGRLWWDEIKFRLPKIGWIVFRATLARFARATAMTFAAGVPTTLALQLIARATDNEFLAGKISQMAEGIERGESMVRAAARTRVFSPLVLQMIAIGEQTGRLDEMMQEVADYYDREVDYDIEHLSDLIEPVMLLIVGGMVLVLALGIFLPMWEMTGMAKAK
ncbi:MAG: type II secretion system F family protein [Hydrogenophilus sp.]|nr:type II secretion system F family protein [Hydrogenophilus sp.]